MSPVRSRSFVMKMAVLWVVAFVAACGGKADDASPAPDASQRDASAALGNVVGDANASDRFYLSAHDDSAADGAVGDSRNASPVDASGSSPGTDASTAMTADASTVTDGGPVTDGGAATDRGAATDGGSAADGGPLRSDGGDNGLRLVASAAHVDVGSAVTFTVYDTQGDGGSRDVTDLVVLSASPASALEITGHSGKGLQAELVRVTAQWGERSATATITVGPGQPLVVLSGTPTSCQVGTTVQLHATANLNHGNIIRDVTNDVLWTATNDAATVDSHGLVTCSALGKVYITAELPWAQFDPSTLFLVVDSRVQGFVVKGPAVLHPNSSAFYELDAHYADKDVKLTDVHWEVSNSDVVSLDLFSGEASGLVPGGATLTGTVQDIGTASLKVTVSAALLQSLVMIPSHQEIVLPATAKFSALGTYVDGTQGDLTHACSWDTDNAGALSDGKFAAVVLGPSKVTAKAPDTNITAMGDVNVLVGSPDRLQIGAPATSEDQVPQGYSYRPLVTTNYGELAIDATPQSTLHVNDTSIATVSGPTVVGVKPGLTTYTASLGSWTSAPRTLRVTSAALLTLDFDSPRPMLALGDVFHLSVWGTFDDGSQFDVSDRSTLKSANAQVVSVSNDPATRGQLHALAWGTTTITATLGTLQVVTAVTVSP